MLRHAHGVDEQRVHHYETHAGYEVDEDDPEPVVDVEVHVQVPVKPWPELHQARGDGDIRVQRGYPDRLHRVALEEAGDLA